MTFVAGASPSWLSYLHSQGVRCGQFLRVHFVFMHSLCFLFSLTLSQQSQAVQIIAHVSVPIEQTSMKELRAIYTMRLQRWEGGGDIQVFVLPQHNSTHQKFCKGVLQVLPHQLQAVWFRLVYSGMGRAPVEVQTEKEMIERVRRTPGAIGYLESSYELHDEKIVKLKLQP